MGQTYQSITIDAPVEQVWRALRDFHDMSWAPNVIDSVEAVADRGADEPGAGRVLNGVVHETLRSVDDEARTLTYSIDDGPSPVSREAVRNYRGRVTVRPITEGSGAFVEWASAWERNDEAAEAFCHGIYVALLRDLKRTLEP